MQYSCLHRVLVLRGPRSLLQQHRHISVHTSSAQPVSLNKRSALRVPSYSPHELQAMSSQDLKSLMKDNGLKYAGNRSVLVDRATRYVHQHLPITTSTSSRLHSQLASRGLRASQARQKPAAAAAALRSSSSSTVKPLSLNSKTLFMGASSALKSSIRSNAAADRQAFGSHDPNFGTKLAARAHFEGSSLSWAAPPPAPPMPQPNASFVSSSASSTKVAPVWNKANFGDDTFHKSYTIGAKFGPAKASEPHSPLQVMHQEVVKAKQPESSSSKSTKLTASVLRKDSSRGAASTAAAAIKKEKLSAKSYVNEKVSAKSELNKAMGSRSLTASKSSPHAVYSAKPAPKSTLMNGHKTTAASSSASTHANHGMGSVSKPATTTHDHKIESLHLASPQETGSVAINSSKESHDMLASSIKKAAAALQHKNPSTNSTLAAATTPVAASSSVPRLTTPTYQTKDLRHHTQQTFHNQEKKILETPAFKVTVTPKPAETSVSSSKAVHHESIKTMVAPASTMGTFFSSHNSKMHGDGMKQTAATIAASTSAGSSSPSSTSSHSSKSSSGDKTGGCSSSSSSSSSMPNKKSQNSDGWNKDKIPTGTSAFPTLLGLTVIAWFIVGKRDRWLQEEERKRLAGLKSESRYPSRDKDEEVVVA
ncbi:hypothetical protein BGZ83_011699 [Gryganskiella cystojenkinii]|nr:hypothetical protein BGZ83_011699 [Gryganskiella cystojenkinii]